MSIELIQNEPDFHTLKEDWNALLESSASHVPFLRHEFLASWWQTMGGREWEHGELAILLHRDDAGLLDGIAPFFITDGRIMFLGSHEISDYLDFIARPDHLPAVIEDSIAFLQGQDLPGWESLDLYNLPEDSPSLPYLRDAARKAGLKLTESVLQTAPYLPLPETWEAYLGNLQDRYRRDIEKKIREAENYFLPVSWYITEDPDLLDQELDEFLELMANHPEKERFLTAAMVQQMKASAREAFQACWLQLAFLQVGDIKAAGYLNFDFDGQIWIYNSGINTLFENISPGWVLLGKIIRWAIENGKSKVDFMRGDETYKYQFGGIDQKVLRLQISK